MSPKGRPEGDYRSAQREGSPVNVHARLPVPGFILGFDDYAAPAERLAAHLKVPCERIAVHRFPDGESRVTVPVPLPAHVAICRSLDHPNDKLVEALLAAATARQHGARTVSLVAPYLCYMRQDVEFAPGEAVSQRIVGRLLADHFDAVVTVDPHLHRVATLAEAVPAKFAVALSAAALFGEYLQQSDPDAVLVGPDEESVQWLAAAAHGHRFETVVCRKTRRGDRDVAIDIPSVRLAGRAVVLVDDMASTGTTLAVAARLCLDQGARTVDALVVHGLFVGDAVADLRRAGVRHVWSTDSVVHPTNVLPLAPLLANAMRVESENGVMR
jgi:ribose-phosphate pyrophosphokinase